MTRIATCFLANIHDSIVRSALPLVAVFGSAKASLLLENPMRKSAPSIVGEMCRVGGWHTADAVRLQKPNANAKADSHVMCTSPSSVLQ